MRLSPVKELSKPFILMPYQTTQRDDSSIYGTLLMDGSEGPEVFWVYHQPEGLFYDPTRLSSLRQFDYTLLTDERTKEIYYAVSLLNSIPLYLDAVDKEREALRYIITIQDKKSEFFEYLLVDRQFVNREDKAGSISLDLHLDTSAAPKRSLSKQEYNQYLSYRVIREVEGLCRPMLFPYTNAGFLKALDCYQGEIATYTLQKSV